MNATIEDHPMAETFTYDVFISHSAKDKPAVRELAERLRKDGLRVWPGVFEDDWEIKPGDSIPRKMKKAWSNRRRW
ncbi:MAG: toll/interleukin-1 receptor domain-containing protein [Blastocatellia bacterium]